MGEVSLNYCRRDRRSDCDGIQSHLHQNSINWRLLRQCMCRPRVGHELRVTLGNPCMPSNRWQLRRKSDSTYCFRKYYRSNKRRNKGGHHDMRVGRRGLLGQRSVLGEADDLQRAERLFLWHNDPHLEQFQFQFYR